MSLVLRDQAHYTYGEYRRWPDEQRYELIHGLAYARSPAPSVAHQETVLALARQIADALEGSGYRALIAPIDVRLPAGAEADDRVDTVVQPDLLVVCDADKVDTLGVRGAPDWVIEVLSPATIDWEHVTRNLPGVDQPSGR